MTRDEALEWADGTPEYRRMDIYQRDCCNEEALDVLAAEVRRLREALESALEENTELIRALERIELIAQILRLERLYIKPSHGWEVNDDCQPGA